MTTLIYDYEERMLPILVYGTLREGEGNRYPYETRVKTDDLFTLTGMRMYSNGGFPYLVASPEPEDSVVVEMVSVIRPESYERVLVEMDSLEGFSAPGSDHNHYDRVMVSLDHVGASGTIYQGDAYLYVAHAPEREVARHASRVSSGDWMDVARERDEYRARLFSDFPARTGKQWEALLSGF